jgi:hypothetical protein
MAKTRILPAGTTVTLHLKPDRVMDEVFDQAEKQLLCSEIETELILDSEVSCAQRNLLPPQVETSSGAIGPAL